MLSDDGNRLTLWIIELTWVKFA